MNGSGTWAASQAWKLVFFWYETFDFHLRASSWNTAHTSVQPVQHQFLPPFFVDSNLLREMNQFSKQQLVSCWHSSFNQQLWTRQMLTQKLWLLVICMDLPWSINPMYYCNGRGNCREHLIRRGRGNMVESGKGNPWICYLRLQRRITWCTITNLLIQGFKDSRVFLVDNISPDWL